jgi:hypothetical protein
VRLGLGSRAIALGAAHAAALVLLHVLLEHYEPEPNGFRFHSLSTSVGIAVSLLPPVVVGLLAVRRAAVGAIAVIQAASPLLLLGNLRDPGSDLALAVLLWWFPLPVVVGTIALLDRHRARDR